MSSRSAICVLAPAILAQAAKVAGLSLDGFIELLGTVGLAAVDYPAEELADELSVAG